MCNTETSKSDQQNDLYAGGNPYCETNKKQDKMMKMKKIFGASG